MSRSDSPVNTLGSIQAPEDTGDHFDPDQVTEKTESPHNVPENIETDGGQDMGSKGSSKVHRLPLLTVTTVMGLVVSAKPINELVVDQYLYKVYSTQIFGNQSGNTRRHPCINATGNVSQSAMTHKVQELTSQMNLYLDLTSYGLGMLSNILLGTYAGLISRRVLMAIPIAGNLVRCSLLPVVAHWSLDLRWLFLGFVADGVCGNVCGLFLAVFLYTADVTPSDKRHTMAVVFVEALKGIFGATMNIVGGALVEETGFMIPSVLCSGLLLLACLLICFLPDLRPETSENEKEIWTLRGTVRKMASPFIAHHDSRVTKLVRLGAVGFFVIILVRVGISKVRNLYLMNLPFCLDALSISWLMFGREMGYNLFSLLSVRLFYRFLPGVSLGIVGVVSLMAGYILYGLATVRGEIYTTPVVSVGQQLPVSVIRGEMSRLLSPEEQGPLFASIAVFESIAFALSPTIFLSIYQASLDVMSGIAFLAATGFLIPVLLVLVWFQVIWRARNRDVQYNVFNYEMPTGPVKEKEMGKVV